jgi:hypothetical protein
VITLAYPGFRPNVTAISQLVETLDSLKLTKNDTVVLDLLSNVAFLGIDDNGPPAEAMWAEDGRYHVVGSLATAPPSVIKKNLASCTPMGEVLGNAGTVLISPVPRYVYNRCCGNVSHVENLTDSDYDEEIGMGLEGINRLNRNWASELLLDFELIDPTMLNDACVLGVKTRVTNTRSCPWVGDDPVHLTTEGYCDLAGHIKEHINAEPASNEASASGSDVSGNKRQAPESVVTRPPAPPPKRGRGLRPPRVAGWLMGHLDPDHQGVHGGAPTHAVRHLQRGTRHWG